VTSVEIAGPGFINLRSRPTLARESWHHPARGRGLRPVEVGKNERVNVEYVSANPTGPMHMGHCRGAVVGDALARLLEAAGFRVTKEYYVNDAGRRSTTLARSAAPAVPRGARARHRRDPEGLYPGDYLKPSDRAAPRVGDRYVDAPERVAATLPQARVAAMLDLIRHDLGLLDIHHDLFSSEGELQRSGASDEAMQVLRGQGPGLRGRARTAEEPRSARRVGAGRADLFRSSQFGDDQDRTDEEIGRKLDLFRFGRRLSLAKGQNRRSSRQHLGADHAGTVKRVQSA
jgi:arginyl-tRNA synthetase